jgi:hypothetical protein
VLLDRFYYAGPNAGLEAEAAAPALDLYRAQNPDGKPANSFATGYAGGAVMAQFLEAACAAGDLTREGVLAAKNSLDAVETGGLTGTLDYSTAGISPTRESFVARPDATAPGGSVAVAELYEGPTAESYERE